MSIVNQARKFAEHWHRHQVRKYTNEPYFVHLHEVATLCAGAGLSKRAVAAAYLHDVIEDQPVTYENVRERFGREVADIVRELTDTPATVGVTREERKLNDLGRLEAASADAQSIKCADLVSNTSSITKHDRSFARVYLPEKRAVLMVLTRANPELLALAWKTLKEAEAHLNA